MIAYIVSAATGSPSVCIFISHLDLVSDAIAGTICDSGDLRTICEVISGITDPIYLRGNTAYYKIPTGKPESPRIVRLAQYTSATIPTLRTQLPL